MTRQVPTALLSPAELKLREIQSREAPAVLSMATPVSIPTVLQAAVELALSEGFAAISRSKVADRAGVSRGTVSNAYGDMPGLCEAVMKEAVAKGHLKLIAQGLAARHPIAMGASDDQKRQAAAYLTA